MKASGRVIGGSCAFGWYVVRCKGLCASEGFRPIHGVSKGLPEDSRGFIGLVSFLEGVVIQLLGLGV